MPRISGVPPSHISTTPRPLLADSMTFIGASRWWPGWDSILTGKPKRLTKASSCALIISGAVASNVLVTVRLEALALATRSLNDIGLGALACAASTEDALVKNSNARAMAVTVGRFIG